MTAISVIVSTYNRPEFLERVLRGYAIQTDKDFELVIADDGSDQRTAALLKAVKAETGMRIVHVWHEHRGFRKSVILNRSILASRGQYLVFTDGDCIPKRDLIEVHRTLSRPRRYVAGGYLKLPEELSVTIDKDDIDSGRITNLAWLRERGWHPGRRALRLFSPSTFSIFMDAVTPTAADFNGNNASVWRDVLFEVNGFEGEMGYGGLDRALGLRLQNAGVKGIQARYRAVAMHLHHDRPYRDAAMVRANLALISKIKKNGEVRARRGIKELEPDPSLHVDGKPVFGD